MKFDAHYNVTSVDPPELYYFIRDQYPAVSIDVPHDENGKRISMWSLIAANTMPPTMKYRYCCEKLKEIGGQGRVTVTGVRWAESVRRKTMHDVVDFTGKPKGTVKIADELGVAYRLNKNGSVILNDDNDANRRMVEQCYRTRKTLVNPIVDWEDDDVWEYLNDVAKVPHCRLYDEGFKRLGCIGCPMGRKSGMEKEFARWPKYKTLYLKAFEKMIANRPSGQWAMIDESSNTPPRTNVPLVDSARRAMEWWVNVNP